MNVFGNIFEIYSLFNEVGYAYPGHYLFFTWQAELQTTFFHLSRISLVKLSSLYSETAVFLRSNPKRILSFCVIS